MKIVLVKDNFYFFGLQSCKKYQLKLRIFVQLTMPAISFEAINIKQIIINKNEPIFETRDRAKHMRKLVNFF